MKAFPKSFNPKDYKSCSKFESFSESSIERIRVRIYNNILDGYNAVIQEDHNPKNDLQDCLLEDFLIVRDELIALGWNANFGSGSGIRGISVDLERK
jgi:hypothetical protein